MSDTVPLFQIDWNGEEIKNVVDSVTRGSFWANGPYIDEFERELESYHNTENAIVFNSGTSALIAALNAHGVGVGDEVIVPSFTFISTANAAKIVGATPRFVDIDQDRYGLDPAAVESNITEETAAIVPVHYAGKPCLIGELRKIADAHDIPLIEDAAEAFGAQVKGEPVGSFGDSAMLSFCQNKVITTGEGGAILTDDEEIAARCRRIRSHGRASEDYFADTSAGEYVSLGQNYRMPDVVAAIGVAQIEKAEDIIRRRRRVAQRYNERLRGIEGITCPSDPPKGRHVYQLYTVTFNDEIDRDAVIERLTEQGVSSKVYFNPAHESQYYQTETSYASGSLSVTSAVSDRVLSLPMDPNMSIETTERVVNAVDEAVTAVR